ncbi:MAG: hypothetical protein ACRCZK_04250 [Oscillospiraceae bacterium]
MNIILNILLAILVIVLIVIVLLIILLFFNVKVYFKYDSRLRVNGIKVKYLFFKYCIDFNEDDEYNEGIDNKTTDEVKTEDKLNENEKKPDNTENSTYKENKTDFVGKKAKDKVVKKPKNIGREKSGSKKTKENIDIKIKEKTSKFFSEEKTVFDYIDEIIYLMDKSKTLVFYLLKKTKVKKLLLDILINENNPYDTALYFGKLNAYIMSGINCIKSNVNIKKFSLKINSNFVNEDKYIKCNIKAFIKPINVTFIILKVGFPLFKKYILKKEKDD